MPTHPSRIFFLLFGLISACGYLSENLSYPPLDKTRLVGCWVEFGEPEPWCGEKCFSSTGLYYGRSNMGLSETGIQRFVESSGSYSVAGRRNAVVLTIRRAYNGESPDTAVQSFEENYTFMRDTLFSITNNGLNFNPYERSDSSNSCGPKWQVLPRPEGWDLD